MSDRLSVEKDRVLGGKYRLLRPVGSGGMAQVWAARNESTHAEVCVKILAPESIDDEAVKRFRREANVGARLGHRAIVRVYDLLELDADGANVRPGNAPVGLAIVMDLLRGESLGEGLKREGRVTLDMALDIMLPVLSGLGHAHADGVVHRDLKPDNVFLSVDDDGHMVPKLLDFGVSKVRQAGGTTITSFGARVGTPRYMSPEQAEGSTKIDARSDVFSAGTLLYRMLSGRDLFGGDTLDAVVREILEHEAEPIEGLPAPVWNVIAKALEKDPAKRYRDASKFGAALAHAAGRAEEPELTTQRMSPPLDGDDAVDEQPASPRSTRLVVVVGVVSAVVFLGGVGLVIASGRRGGGPPPSSTGTAATTTTGTSTTTNAPATTTTPAASSTVATQVPSASASVRRPRVPFMRSHATGAAPPTASGPVARDPGF